MGNDSKAIRILLVEDSEHDRIILRRIFKKACIDCQITDFIKAEEALERVRSDSSSFDIVVADQTLPGMTGLELCRTLISEKTELPMVLLTGTGSEEFAVEALKSGVDDYITKDTGIHMETLPYVLRDVIRRRDEKRAREKAEDALLNERNMFVDGPVVVFKWRNEEGCPVEYVSPNVYDVLGYQPEEFLSREIAYSAIIHNEDIERVAEEVKTNIAKDAKNFSHKPYRIAMKDGSYVWLHEHTTIIRDEKGKVTHYLGYIINITDRKRIELDLEKAKKDAETANKAKSDFLANMSHELRTPLNAITGFSEILKDGMIGDMPERQRDLIQDIYDSSDHLLSLINDILDLSKIESGNMKLEISEVNLPELIEISHLFIKNKLLSGTLKLTMEIEESIGVISADKRLLKQVLINLLSNAAKFTPEGGHIRVVAEKVKDNSGNENMIEIFIEDTGIGIKQEDLGKIFEPFKQVESVATKKYQGTGLGLSICKDIVEMHGGRIWVESEWEKGSKFIFTLPASKK